MGNIVSLYRKFNPLPFDEEMLMRTAPIYKRLEDYFYTHDRSNAYIIRTFGEADEVDWYMSSKYRNTHLTIGRAMDGYQEKYGKDFKGVLYYSDKEWDGCLSLNEEDSALSGKMARSCVFDVSEALESELYKGYKDLLMLRSVISSSDGEEVQEYLKGVLGKQEVVDYVIKLQRIGEDSEVFSLLTQREDAYIKLLFDPLSVITQQVKLKKTEVVSGKLTQIIKWSSTRLVKIEEDRINESKLSNIKMIDDEDEEESKGKGKGDENE